ncbi:MAG: hypothetical protein ACLFV3_10910, partial [Phycisphaeraceae bacterium]
MLTGALAALATAALCGSASGAAPTPPHVERDSSGNITNLPAGGMNLAEVAYFSRQIPFTNAMKQADDWVSEDTSGSKDSRSITLTDDKYPASLESDQVARAYVYAHNDGNYPTGDYVLEWDGDGNVDLGGNNITLNSTGTNRKVYTVSAADNLGFLVRITQTNSSNPVHNIRLWVPGYENSTNMYIDEFKADLEPFAVLRFMDWGQINDSELQYWEDRPRTSWANWSKDPGTPYEAMIELCNETDKDLWLCVPHLATDNYIRELARLVRDDLDPDLNVWLEYSNEIWFDRWGQGEYITDEADATGKTRYEVMAELIMNTHSLFVDEFGGRDRIVRVVASQPGNPWVFDQVMQQIGQGNADVGATAYYWGNTLETLEWINDNAGNLDKTEAFNRIHNDILGKEVKWTDWANYCDTWGLALVAYEGNQHYDAIRISDSERHPDLVTVLSELCGDSRMYDEYTFALNQWKDIGGTTAVAFSDVGPWNLWGQWGHRQYLNQPLSEAPLAKAVADWADANSSGFDVTTDGGGDGGGDDPDPEPGDLTITV